jgi:hypothetical protein
VLDGFVDGFNQAARLNLLEGQQLRLIEPVTIRSRIGGFQQLRFIIEMKCR